MQKKRVWKGDANYIRMNNGIYHSWKRSIFSMFNRFKQICDKYRNSDRNCHSSQVTCHAPSEQTQTQTQILAIKMIESRQTHSHVMRNKV